MSTIAIIVLSIVVGSVDRHADRLREVDLIEVNYRTDEVGKTLYVQAIFWKWMPEYRRYKSQGFVLLDETTLSGWPEYKNGMYYVQKAKVKAKLIRYSRTTFDPERQAVKLNGDR